MTSQPVPLCVADDTTRQELWGIKTVARHTGLSRASVYRYTAKGNFPQRRLIGPGRVAWLASEVLAWMESRPKVQ